MLRIWLAFMFVAFAVTVVAGSMVQIREHGSAKAFRERRLLDVYWHERTALERALLWPGFIAFLVTVIAIAIATLVRRFV